MRLLCWSVGVRCADEAMATESFTPFVLDQLKRLRSVDCRAMFGGHGLYHDGAFFGIIFKGQLYFKTTPSSRSAYLQYGMEPFRPSATQVLKTYYEVPAEIIEDDERLTAWARDAIAAQPSGPARRR